MYTAPLDDMQFLIDDVLQGGGSTWRLAAFSMAWMSALT